MPPASASLIDQLKASHLFSRLDDETLQRVSQTGERIALKPGEVLAHPGTRAGSFYLILDGCLRLNHRQQGQDISSGELSAGDFYGAEEILDHRPLSAGAEAAGSVSLFKLDSAPFLRLLHASPEFRAGLALELRTRRLIARADLSWLSGSEAVQFIAHRHGFFLLAGLVLPLLIFLIAASLLGIMYAAGITPVVPYLAAGVLSAAGLLWAAWNGLDWGNDYYLVTNQRVVWMERVLGFYDSRQEAPLSTILSVGVTTSQAGRILGWGDVVVRTYTGTVVFRRLGSPQAVAGLVEEHWRRAQSQSRQGEVEAMSQAIRRRLGRTEDVETAAPGTPVSQQAEISPAVQNGPVSSWLGRLYKMRFEDGEVVTYRKHWFILIRSTWKPAALTILGVVLGGARLLALIHPLSLPAFLALDGAFTLVCVLWYLYQYLDWRNDIYQVTADQIVDIDKKPLGREERRAAPLDNILSIQYERLGIIGLLLNFGTVAITVGNAKFTFDYVYNPSQVQKDLFNRMEARNAQKHQDELASERERVSEWFAVYNEIAGETALPEAPAPEDFEESTSEDGPFWG